MPLCQLEDHKGWGGQGEYLGQAENMVIPPLVLPLAICTLRSPCRGGACRSRSPCSSLLSAQPPRQTSGARSPHPSSTPPTVPVGPTGCRRRICDYPAPRPVECCVEGAGRDQRPTGCCKQGVDETKKNDIQGSLQFRMEWGHFCRL